MAFESEIEIQVLALLYVLIVEKFKRTPYVIPVYPHRKMIGEE